MLVFYLVCLVVSGSLRSLYICLGSSDFRGSQDCRVSPCLQQDYSASVAPPGWSSCVVCVFLWISFSLYLSLLCFN